MEKIHIRTEYDRVMIIKDGRIVADMPWDAALQLASAIYKQAKVAEEFAKAEEIILDQAVLIRGAIPIGLSNNPKIQEEAGKEAAWNSKLRKFMPGGVKSQEAVGTPTVIKHPPELKGD